MTYVILICELYEIVYKLIYKKLLSKQLFIRLKPSHMLLRYETTFGTTQIESCVFQPFSHLLSHLISNCL